MQAHTYIPTKEKCIVITEISQLKVIIFSAHLTLQEKVHYAPQPNTSPSKQAIKTCPWSLPKASYVPKTQHTHTFSSQSFYTKQKQQQKTSGLSVWLQQHPKQIANKVSERHNNVTTHLVRL